MDNRKFTVPSARAANDRPYGIVGVILGLIEYWAARKYDAWMQKKAEEKASLV